MKNKNENLKLKPMEFLKLFDQFIAERGEGVAPATLENYRNVRESLRKFSKDARILAIPEDEPKRFRDDIIEYFNYLARDRGLQNGTIGKHKRIITTVINYFELPVVINSSRMTAFKKGEDATDVIVPEYSEIMDMVYHKPQRGHKNHRIGIQKPIDLYLFSAFTGLRFSEAQDLVEENVQERTNGNTTYYVVVYHSHKTGKKNEAPLNDVCLDIIARWKKAWFPKKKHKRSYRLLPYHPPKIINKSLKEALKDVGSRQMKNKYGLGFEDYSDFQPVGFMRKELYVRYSGTQKIEEFRPRYEMLTFHTSRHFFAALLLAKGTDIYKVSKLLGHSQISTTEKWYAKLNVNQVSFEAYNNLNDKLLIN